MTTSLEVARTFVKDHHNVMKAIRNPDIPIHFSEVNFYSDEIFEENASNLKISKSYYKMTRNGFNLIVMGNAGGLANFEAHQYKARMAIASLRGLQAVGC